jgi:hypothetical protein
MKKMTLAKNQKTFGPKIPVMVAKDKQNENINDKSTT